MAKSISALDGNQVLQHGFDDTSQSHRYLNIGDLVPSEFDEIDLTYVAAGNGAGEIETVTYKLDSTTVATLTLSYDGSDRLINVVRS